MIKDQRDITAKRIGIVSVETGLLENGDPAVCICIDDGDDRYHEYVITNIAEVRLFVTHLLRALACHKDQWAENICETFLNH